MSLIFRPDKVVVQLRTIVNITNVVPGGIFSRVIQESAPNQDYLLVNTVSDNDVVSTQDGHRQRQARVEFRIVWGGKNVADSVLLDAMQAIEEEIVNSPCTKIFDYDWFAVGVVRPGTLNWPFVSTNDRPVIVKDYLFSYYA